MSVMDGGAGPFSLNTCTLQCFGRCGGILEFFWGRHGKSAFAMEAVALSRGIIQLDGQVESGITKMNETELLARITLNPQIFGGKPIIRGRRLAVEHVLGMLAAGDDFETILEGYPWLERADIQACLIYARRQVGNERIEPLVIEAGAAG
jgi:uncharacterized protein (DUF433 family)